ncbi:MAG: hypothetical protein LHW56_02620 [Candidatus Cloacimonetes bacterium]|jgi:hypothetical protein|nr:hypothetical protein [Candidatus Cloacimonadota bacterium]MDY0171780.1 hypothetical protein [Candidatus Cloacimonadaceae bacterium]
MVKKILIVLMVCASAHLLAMDAYDTAMGLHFGTSTGNGYSIRKWGKSSAYQVTFAAYATGQRDPNYHNSDFTHNEYHTARKNSVSLGANYLWELHDSDRYKFYVMTGMAYTMRKVKRYYAPDDNKWVRDDRWTIGAGPGFEFEFSDRFHVSVELPMTYNNKDDITMYIPSGGFYYYFK